MRVRVLIGGLTFFAAAMLAAVAPYVAESHGPGKWKPCTIRGTQGPDFINGTSGADVICGLGGNDTLSGLGGNDVIRGGKGADRLEGGLGNDALLGQTGKDRLWSRDGLHDHIYGGPGYDRYRIDGLLDGKSGVEDRL